MADARRSMHLFLVHPSYRRVLGKWTSKRRLRDPKDSPTYGAFSSDLLRRSAPTNVLE